MDSHIKQIFGTLLESSEVDFTGESENPIHKALGIKIIVTQLAGLICTKDQYRCAYQSRFGDVSFTSKQERDFVQLQILLNLHLNSLRLPRLPLLHLSPRMLLPCKMSVGCNDANDSDGVQIDGHDSASPEVKKKAKKKKKKPSASISANTTVESAAEILDPDDDLPALEPCFDSMSQSGSEDAVVYQLPPTSLYRGYSSPSSQSGTRKEASGSDAATRNAQTHAALLRADAQAQAARPYKYSVPRGVYARVEGALGLSAMENVDSLCEAYETALMNQREQHGNIQQSLSMRLYLAQSELEALKEKVGLAAAFA